MSYERMNELKAAMLGRVDQLTAERDALAERVRELEKAGRAIVEAWEFDEIGQVEGEIIERMSCAIGEQP